MKDKDPTANDSKFNVCCVFKHNERSSLYYCNGKRKRRNRYKYPS